MMMQREIIFTNDAPKAIGTYSQAVKIGNTVYVTCAIAGVNTTGAAGGIRVTGLPFTPSPANQMTGNMSVHTGATIPSGTVNVSPYFTSTYVAFYSSVTVAGWAEITHNATGAMWLYFSGTYKV